MNSKFSITSKNILPISTIAILLFLSLIPTSYVVENISLILSFSFGFYGVISSISMDVALNTTKSTLDHIHKKTLEIESSTLRPLSNFEEVFNTFNEMLEHVSDGVIYSSYALKFGVLHTQNQQILASSPNFSDAVNNLQDKLLSRLLSFKKCTFQVLSKLALEKALHNIKSCEHYRELNIDAILDEEMSARERFQTTCKSVVISEVDLIAIQTISVNNVHGEFLTLVFCSESNGRATDIKGYFSKSKVLADTHRYYVQNILT